MTTSFTQYRKQKKHLAIIKRKKVRYYQKPSFYLKPLLYDALFMYVVNLYLNYDFFWFATEDYSRKSLYLWIFAGHYTLSMFITWFYHDIKDTLNNK